MQYILHIDTSSEKAVIALSQDGKLLHQKINTDARNHAATINLLIDDLLKETNIGLDALAALSVMGGPGSYTGLRIGLSTAKAFCYVLDKPLILSNKLDILTLEHIEKYDGKYFLTMLPAREKEYFVCLYNNNRQIITPPQHIFEKELIKILQALDGKTIVGGEPHLLENIEMLHEVEIIANKDFDIGFWCEHSKSLFDCNSFVNLSLAEPFYLKHVHLINSELSIVNKIRSDL